MLILVVFSFASLGACTVFSPFDGCKDFRPTDSRFGIPTRAESVCYYDRNDLPNPEQIGSIISLMKKRFDQKNEKISKVNSKQIQDERKKIEFLNNRIGNHEYFRYFDIDLDRMGIEKLPSDPFKFNREQIKEYIRISKAEGILEYLKQNDGMDLEEIIKNMERDIPALYRLLSLEYDGDTDLYAYMFFKKAQISNRRELIDRITDQMWKLNSLRLYKEKVGASEAAVDNRRAILIKNLANTATRLLRD